jgi:D-beta-D-heptose 7-phosphate kinase/D-beta-D-heptose 1-phosphate adenosyltransferase
MTESVTTQQPTLYKVLLIGDSCLDEYHYGVVERISPEAPVPILKITRTETKPGMAANVKDNLEAFGLEVDFLTGGARSIKKRFIDERSKQHILRVDEDKPSVPFNAWRDSLAYSQYDAIVISDYDKGLITYENVRAVREQFRGPIFIDSKKKDLEQFEGCYVKVNELERSVATSTCTDMIITLGGQGAEYNGVRFRAPVVEVVDVCGAGDTFISALVAQYLNTRDIDDAIDYAIAAASISVQHSGVYSLKKQDIENIENDRIFVQLI